MSALEAKLDDIQARIEQKRQEGRELKAKFARAKIEFDAWSEEFDRVEGEMAELIREFLELTGERSS